MTMYGGNEESNITVRRRPRFRYFRGHGIHSPFVYSLVRQVFMPREITGSDRRLYEELRSLNIPGRMAVQLQNLYAFGNYTGFRIDCNGLPEMENILDIYIGRMPPDRSAQEKVWTNHSECIITRRNKNKRKSCIDMARSHSGVSIDKRRYFLYFHDLSYRKQHYRL